MTPLPATGGARWHLVRHGESVWNAAGLLQGRTAGVALSTLGRRQARAAAEALASAPVALVLSSDQRRCRQTAALIAHRHALAVRPEPALREQGHGCWEGLPAAPYGAALAAAGPDWAPPGGETARSLHARVAALVDRLRGEGPPPGDVVLVSHGETIRALLAVLAGRGPEAMPRTVPANGAVRTVPAPRWPLVGAAR